MADLICPEPSPELFQKVIKRIHKEQRLLVLRQTIIFSVTLFASLVAFIPAFLMLSSDASQSGFLNFSSLVFSDFSFVLAYWKNFAMALLETLPAVSLAVFLLVAVIFLQSLKSLIISVKTLNKVRLGYYGN